jgi:hypothetical protein
VTGKAVLVHPSENNKAAKMIVFMCFLHYSYTGILPVLADSAAC